MNKTIFVLSLLSICMAATGQENHPDSTDVFYKHLQLNEIVVTGLAGDSDLSAGITDTVNRKSDIIGKGNITDLTTVDN